MSSWILISSQEVKTCEIVKEEKIAEQVKIAQKLRAKDGSRIVNGYNVDKRCMSRPWIVFIRSEQFSKSYLSKYNEGSCRRESIILRQATVEERLSTESLFYPQLTAFVITSLDRVRGI